MFPSGAVVVVVVVAAALSGCVALPEERNPGPPLVSGVQVRRGATSAVVSWWTDEPATSEVRAGPAGHAPTTVRDDTRVELHEITLRGLTCDRVYRYRLRSSNEHGETTTSSVRTFTTRGCPPTIDVFYGSSQPSGTRALAQRWVNVLGTASDPDGVAGLSYTLNGGPSRRLAVGPDGRRLHGAGDFNVEIDAAELVSGLNVVVVTAWDGHGNAASDTVMLEHTPRSDAPLPFATDLRDGSTWLEQVQVVDGRWELRDGRLAVGDAGYDRVVAVGDRAWGDYEVRTSVRVDRVTPADGSPWMSGAPLVGLALRWSGHSPEGDARPAPAVYPVGAYVWYEWQDDGRWEMTGNEGSPIDAAPTALALGATHELRARVEDVAGGTHYRFKHWPAGTPEPADWTLDLVEDAGNATGSVALIAHHVDASFGDVVVTPLA